MKRLLFFTVVAAVVLALVFLVGSRTYNIERQGEEESISHDENSFAFHEGLSTLTQQSCDHPRRRPLAVMMSSDEEARPLAGIADADIVVEMPVLTGLITRIMALFQCSDVERIGSVRSSRHDFIPFAATFDAIYAHWGGSVLALRVLDSGVIDAIDALVNARRTYWEEPGVRRPHAGFTSTQNLLGTAEYLEYRTETDITPFLMQPEPNEGHAGTLVIGYHGAFIVSFIYDPQTGSYRRLRDGRPEIDKNTGDQVRVSNVIVMRAVSRQVLDDYNDVVLEGEGEAFFYRNGREQRGSWRYQEHAIGEPLQFYDEDGNDVFLQPGKTWLSVVEPDQSVRWVVQP